MRVGGSEGRREEGRREGGGNREWVSFVPEQKILKRPVFVLQISLQSEMTCFYVLLHWLFEILF